VRRHGLSILAIVSLVLLAVLLCGDFIDGDTYLGRASSTGGAVTTRYLAIASARGAIFVSWGKFTVPSTRPSGAGYGMGRGRWNIGLPRVLPSLLGFVIEDRNVPTRRTFTLACPNWFLIIPCTIAPIVWLRRRRRDNVACGFEVACSASPRNFTRTE